MQNALVEDKRSRYCMLEAEQKVKVGERALQFWHGFVSLIWLDGSINFIFRFIAKTSALLLAIGIVISAADFLTDGRLMHNNLMLANAWAWTQSEERRVG